MKLSPAQLRSFHKSTGRVNLWHGPVRQGKTFVSILRWIDYARQAPPGTLYMFGKTLYALRRNVVNPMREMIGPDMRYSDQTIKLWGREIFTIGANDAQAEGKIRGSTSAGNYYDEVTLLPEGFFVMSLSRLSIANAKGFGTTNPDAPSHWLKKKYMDRAEELNWRMFTWSLDETPFLDPEFVEALKREYTGLFFRRFIKGEWVMAEGAIYDHFDEGVHVVDELPYATPDYYIVGVDYGTGNPTVFMLMGVKIDDSGKPIVVAEHEYYYDSAAHMRQKTDMEYAEDLKAFIQNTQGPLIPGSNAKKPPVIAIYVDPSAASFKLECIRQGLPIEDADNSVIDGIRFQSMMLANGQYFLHRRCKHAIEEYAGYVWDAKKQLLGIDAPVKRGDHAKDAERYGLFTHFGGNRTIWTPAALRM